MYRQASVQTSKACIWSQVLALFCVLSMHSIIAAQRAVLVDYPSREDFQGDSLGQWASYPPAQDIGYEPSLTPTSDLGAPGGRSLMRWIKPTSAGDLRMGFIRKLDLTANGTGSIAFDYRINAPGKRARIEIGMAGADGHRYTTTVEAAVDSWAKASVALRELRRADGSAPAVGTGFEAVYLIALVGNAGEDTVYRFLIDNVSISGGKQAALEIIAPRSLASEPWRSAISAIGFRPGEVLRIEVRSPVSLTRASSRLIAGNGHAVANVALYDDATHGDKAAGDNVWTNDSVHRFANADPTGVWRTELQGETADRRTVSAGLRFLVHSGNVSQHPRLYFSGADKARLVERTRDPRLAKVWEYIRATAKNSRASGAVAHGGDVFKLLDTEYLLPSLLGYFDVLNRARSRIAYNAFASYLTDDAEARKTAKETLLAVSRWHRWEPPWFTAHGQHTYYPAGLLAVDVALGYDLLYEHLSEAERSKVRRALIEKQIIPTYKEYFLDNRAMADTSNWISHTVGGAMIAASAIAADVTPEESGGKFDLYVNGLLMKIEAHMAASYLPDGSYGEGISYQEFDSETLAPMINAVERNLGVDYWNTTRIKDSLRYALYIRTDPLEASLDMGDTHPPAGFGISPLIYRSKDPVMRWYYSKFDRPSLQHFIFFDDSVPPRAPDSAGMPDSAIFEDKGNAVFRTGWGEDSIAMLFRAGPNFNHHHADQGSFLITAFGEPLVTEAGWSDYYKDPYYATFFTQAVGHNTVLVDGNPESQIIPDTPQFKALNDYPRITDSVTSKFYDGVGSDLASVYPARVQRYARRVVFMKPHYFVLYDDLKTRGRDARFNFLVHMPNRAAIKTDGSTAVYSGAKAAVAVRSFVPDDALLSVNDGRIPYPTFSARTPAETPPQPAYLDFGTARPANETQFLTTVVPAKTSGAAADLIGKMFPITGENAKGVRVERGAETDFVIFRTGAATLMRRGEWSADASVLALTNHGFSFSTFAAENARLVTNGKQLMFSAETVASIAAKYDRDEINAVVNSKTGTKVVLFVGSKPARVAVDGIATSDSRFNPADRTVSLSLSKGQHEVRISLR